MPTLEPHHVAPPTASPIRLRLVRALEALVAIAVCVPVFGGVVPFVLLAAGLLPSHGLGNLVYVFAGASIGLLIGILGAFVTLRGDAWIPRRFVLFVLPLALVVLAALGAARWYDAFAHV